MPAAEAKGRDRGGFACLLIYFNLFFFPSTKIEKRGGRRREERIQTSLIVVFCKLSWTELMI